MNFKGQIRLITELRQGVTKGGNQWAKRSIQVEETDVQHPQSILVDLWDSDALVEWKVGDKVSMSLSFKSYVYEQRPYNDIRAWKITRIE